MILARIDRIEDRLDALESADYGTLLEELRAFRAEAHADREWLANAVGELMSDYYSQLVGAISLAENEIDAKIAIINNQTTIFKDVVAQLQVISAHPVPSREMVDGVIAGLNTHIGNLATAASNLTAAEQPAAAAVVLDPVVEPVKATVVEPAAVVEPTATATADTTAHTDAAVDPAAAKV
jgi:hypothetical protein